MKGLKKFLSLLLSAAIMLGCITSLGLTAAAEEPDGSSMEKAIPIESGVKTEGQGTKFYEINVRSEGELSVKYSYKAFNVNLIVFDEDGSRLTVENLEINSGHLFTGNFGRIESGVGYDNVWLEYDSSSLKVTDTATYKVKKGIYYIKPETQINYQTDCTGYVTATFPSDESEDVNITGLKITLNKGDVLQLGVLLSGDSGEVEWKSSKISVVSVTSSGKISAKKKGTAYITAACGKSTIKIKVTVK